MTNQYIIIIALSSALGGAVIGSILFFFAGRALLSLKMKRRAESAQFSQEVRHILEGIPDRGYLSPVR